MPTPPRPGPREDDRPSLPDLLAGRLDGIDSAIEQTQAAVASVARSVDVISNSWGTLLRSIGEISTQLREHERRLVNVEARVFEPATDDMGVDSPTGRHRVLTHSDFARLKERDELTTWRQRSAAVRSLFWRVASHILVAAATGAAVLAWRYFAK